MDQVREPGLWPALSALDYCPVRVLPARIHTKGMSTGRFKDLKLSRPMKSSQKKHYAYFKRAQ